MRILGVTFLIYLLLLGCASTGISPEMGDMAPDFKITDVSGKQVILSDFRGEKNVVLIFYESHL